MAGSLHIHAPQPTLRAINSGTCLDCGKRSRFAGLMTPWYGWRTTCLRCGRVWCDSEWMPLDFVRGARARSIESAKRSYRRAASHSELLTSALSASEGVAARHDRTGETT